MQTCGNWCHGPKNWCLPNYPQAMIGCLQLFPCLHWGNDAWLKKVVKHWLIITIFSEAVIVRATSKILLVKGFWVRVTRYIDIRFLVSIPSREDNTMRQTSSIISNQVECKANIFSRSTGNQNMKLYNDH